MLNLENNQLILNLEKTHVIKFIIPKALDYSLHILHNDEILILMKMLSS
jgi:hypothetical protein